MRILFIGPNRIGDSVLASGLLDHLIREHPEARLTIACGVAAAPLFEAVPGLESLIAMTKAYRGAHWWRLWRRVVLRRWDMVVDLRRSVIPWTILARRRFVAPSSSAQPPEHAVVTFARALGLEQHPPAPHLWVGDVHRRHAESLIPAGGDVLAIGPTANWAGKIWRAENFLEAVRQITGASNDPGAMPDARVAVFGAAAERAIAAPLLEALPPERVIDLVGSIDLPTAAACLARCEIYIGNDSGLMHMAAAMGAPTLGLFGPSLPERYGPWGPHTDWVRTDKDLDEIVGAPGYDHRTAATQMDSLPVGRVVNAAMGLRRRVLEQAA